MYPRLVGHLAQRLQVEDWYRRHPEIDDVPIVAPLFGLGLPRTGSTALSFLLAQDPNIRYLRSGSRRSRARRRRPCEGHDPRIAQALASGGHEGPRPGRRQRADGVPRPHGPGLQDAHLPGVRAHPVVRGVAARRRPHVRLPLRASGAEAAAVGRADAAVAAEDARAHPLPRVPGPRLPRRSLRHDAPRPDRRDAVGRRCVRRHRRRVHRPPRPSLRSVG